MIEIGLGLIAILAGTGIAAGLTEGLIPFPLGRGAVITAFVLAAALILRGIFRLARRRASVDQHALRTLGLMTLVCGLTIVTALALPSLSETLNVVTIGGFPFGLYLMAQGALIFFIALLFLYAVRQERIDRENDTTSDPMRQP